MAVDDYLAQVSHYLLDSGLDGRYLLDLLGPHPPYCVCESLFSVLNRKLMLCYD